MCFIQHFRLQLVSAVCILNRGLYYKCGKFNVNHFDIMMVLLASAVTSYGGGGGMRVYL